MTFGLHLFFQSCILHEGWRQIHENKILCTRNEKTGNGVCGSKGSKFTIEIDTYLNHMRLYVQFLLQNTSGNYEYSYLYVTVNHVGTIVIEDNQGTSKTRQDHESTMDFNLLLDNQ